MASNVPAGLTFADLRLEFAPDGRLLLLSAPLAEMCRPNGMNADATIADEDLQQEVVRLSFLALRRRPE
jgi:hypothetical protein